MSTIVAVYIFYHPTTFFFALNPIGNNNVLCCHSNRTLWQSILLVSASCRPFQEKWQSTIEISETNSSFKIGWTLRINTETVLVRCVRMVRLIGVRSICTSGIIQHAVTFIWKFHSIGTRRPNASCYKSNINRIVARWHQKHFSSTCCNTKQFVW